MLSLLGELSGSLNHESSAADLIYDKVGLCKSARADLSEIVSVPGAQLAGPLPGELGSLTQFTAAIGAGLVAMFHLRFSQL